MTIKNLISYSNRYQVLELFGRYINNSHLELLFTKMPNLQKEVIGFSVQKKPIYGIKFGNGSIRILMWSQMHGNESTTTKALADLFKFLLSDEEVSTNILNKVSIFVIPILNPDGALQYTRNNANDIDLNRDAQELTQPESKVLRSVFDSFRPNYCFNLHGQRTIFSAGESNNPATLSFLAPAQDEASNITQNRKISMALISSINKAMQSIIPNKIGIYDDSFNKNCVGDSFQMEGVPTILIEAGHAHKDYNREKVRKYVLMSYLITLNQISLGKINESEYSTYFDIPPNCKYFNDIVIRNARISPSDGKKYNIGIQFIEKLKGDKIDFIPVITRIQVDSNFFGHKELDANGDMILSSKKNKLKVGDEIDCVLMNSEVITLKP